MGPHRPERDAMAGMKLLEIGFGFGSLAHFLATKYDVQITAVTLSKAQMEPWQRLGPGGTLDMEIQ